MNLKVFISPPSGYGIENMTAILLLIIKILQFHWSFVLILYILNKSVNSSIIELLYFFQRTRHRQNAPLLYSIHGQTDDFFTFCRNLYLQEPEQFRRCIHRLAVTGLWLYSFRRPIPIPPWPHSWIFDIKSGTLKIIMNLFLVQTNPKLYP